ncbi:tetratricopeptide repeat protein [Flavobacterium sp. SM15]|uniref:tetratricopeptide repeat protein n=1 Tax=Flavobacterium sp. SM15 TaxID=2908005 RepID=UPI001EDB5DB2|nr:tetratricopeptide repeat protein [Flavobacterium sp. SM15]MCG2612290.1 tetratricopeptide repeat protein [Flavobacterium sp. SM15]
MKHLITYSFLLFSLWLSAQEKDKNLPKGNDEFQDKNYAEAEAEYRISQFKNPKSATSSYNLGNAIYRQKQAGEAKFSYSRAITEATTKEEKHKAFHNLGNTLMTEKNYQGAVEAYKNALRNNPTDNQTRYNYALAKQKLKENPPKNNKDDKDKNKDQNKDQKPKDNKDQNKDQQDKNKDQNKDKKDDPKNPENKDGKGDQDQKPQQPKPSGATKQRMENLLDALNNEEKKIQERVKGKEVKGSPKRNEKDW